MSAAESSKGVESEASKNVKEIMESVNPADISWSTKARTSLDNVVNNSFAMRLKTIYAEPTIIYEIKEETYGIVLAAQTTYPASEDWWCNIRDPVLYEPLKELAKHGINGVMEGEYKYRYLYFRFLKYDPSLEKTQCKQGHDVLDLKRSHLSAYDPEGVFLKSLTQRTKLPASTFEIWHPPAA